MNTITATVNRIIDNPEGGTCHLVGNPIPGSGYFVGGAGSALIFPSAEKFDHYLMTQFMLRARSEYIGWWTDKSSGKVYVDQVDHYTPRALALRAAEVRGEIAFWDIAAGREIRTAKEV